MSPKVVLEWYYHLGEKKIRWREAKRGKLDNLKGSRLFDLDQTNLPSTQSEMNRTKKRPPTPSEEEGPYLT